MNMIIIENKTNLIIKEKKIEPRSKNKMTLNNKQKKNSKKKCC